MIYKEVGTLAEIGAKVGNVVQHLNFEDGGEGNKKKYFIADGWMGRAAYEDPNGFKPCRYFNLSTNSKFKMFDRATQTGPVRTVTRTTTHKEIVYGQFGVLDVTDVDGGMVQVQIRAPREYRTYINASELREAADHFNALADALAEQETQA